MSESKRRGASKIAAPTAAPAATKPAWNLYFGNGGGPAPDLASVVPPVPEPEFPRIAPTGTGISLREGDVPPASLANIRSACHFYELKCSGKYSSKTLAGRYVFNLSREVQRQVIALEKADSAKTNRISYLEQLVRNWEDTFGHPSDEDLERVFNSAAGEGKRDSAAAADTGAAAGYSPILTPARLAGVLRDRLAENDALKQRMAEMEKSKQDDIDRAQKAIQDHFKANREQFRLDSERLNAGIQQLREQVEQERETQEGRNREFLAEHAKAIQERQEALLAKERSEIKERIAAGIKQGLKDAVAASNKAILKTEAARRDHATEYLRKLADVQRREKTIADRVAGLNDAHAKEVAGLKARYQQLLADTAKRVDKTSKATETTVSNLATENRWLRKRVADLQEMVEAFQGSLGVLDSP